MKKLILVLSLLLLLVACNTKDEAIQAVADAGLEDVVEVVSDEQPEVQEEPVVNEDNTLSYYVNFLNYDGSVLQRSVYKAGETPTYKGTTPTYADGAYTYKFICWDKEFTPVTMTQTYKAVYGRVAITTKSGSPAPTVVDPAPKANLKYDGTEQELITAGSGATFTYSVNDGINFSSTFPTATNAGNYVVEYKKDGVYAGVILVTIAKRNVTVTSSSASKTFDTTPLTNSGLDFTYGGDGFVSGHAVGIQNPGISITDVGSVENTVAVTDVFNTSDLSDVTNNYNITCVSGTLTVTKATATASDFTFTVPNYNKNTVINKVIQPSLGKLTTMYSGDGTNWSDELPTTAGTYKVKVVIEGSKNYNAGEVTDDSWTFTIKTLGIDNAGQLVYINYVEGMTWKEYAASTLNTIGASPNTGESFMISNYSHIGYTSIDVSPNEVIEDKIGYNFFHGPLC